jgi:2,3-dihydroxybenzoate-AMP ligase
MINRRGEKIAAEEIEDLVYRLPGVSQVAAVAMPDPLLGERVCLYVVPKSGTEPGAELTLDQIRQSMESLGIARFKLPGHLVLTDALPATKVGKTDKKALRADITQRLATGRPQEASSHSGRALT